MKKLIISSLSILLLSAVAAPSINAQGQEDSEARVEQGEEAAEKRMTPFALVSAADRGRYEDWGIPSAITLETEYQAGNVTAQDIVDAGVESGELAPQASSDDDYVSFVDSEMEALYAE